VKEKPFRCHCGASYTLRHSLLRHQARFKDCHRGEGAQEGNEATEETHPHPRPVWGRPKKSHRTQEEEEEEGDDGDEQEEGATEGKSEDGGEEGKGAEEGVKRRPLEERGDGGRRAVRGAAPLRRIRRAAGGGEVGWPEASPSDGAQDVVVYVQTLGGEGGAQTEESPAPSVLLASGVSLQGAEHGQEMVEVVMAEGGEQCIVVHGQEMAEGLVILQADGNVCSVAETVEIESG